MNVKELVQSLFKQFAPQLEGAAEQLIDTKVDPAVDAIVAKIESVVKVKFADDMLEVLKPQIKDEVKKFLHSLADQIDGQAG